MGNVERVVGSRDHSTVGIADSGGVTQPERPDGDGVARGVSFEVETTVETDRDIIVGIQAIGGIAGHVAGHNVHRPGEAVGRPQQDLVIGVSGRGVHCDPSRPGQARP